MSGREVREYTNLSDPKDRKLGKGKERIDDEDIAFQRMVSKMQEVAGERGGYLHGRGALDSDDLLYLKEQMEAEEDAERLLRRTEKRAFAAFKRAATLADSSPVPLPLPLRVEPKPKSGIRQQDLLKNVLEIKPKRHRVSTPPEAKQNDQSIMVPTCSDSKNELEAGSKSTINMSSLTKSEAKKTVVDSKSILGLAYESSDDEEEE